MKSSRTREERQIIARRIFEALCERYPDRYIALVERPKSTEPPPNADLDALPIQPLDAQSPITLSPSSKSAAIRGG